jgi:pimeloyl-ACP methyl ester carboxylesterase
VKPGTEKKIFWTNEPGGKSEISLVFIHGFTSSRMPLSPILDEVAKKLNANIFYTRLKGHGQGPDGFIDVKTNDWIQDTREAGLIGKRIGNKVILVSMSTGGPLASYIYAEDPSYAGLIYLSPNFKPADPNAEMILWPWGQWRCCAREIFRCLMR